MQYLVFSFPGGAAFFSIGLLSCLLDTLIPPALTARKNTTYVKIPIGLHTTLDTLKEQKYTNTPDNCQQEIISQCLTLCFTFKHAHT